MNPWDAQWPLDDAEAARRIAKAFPQLADQPVRFLSAGWDNHVFRCGDQLLFRFPRRPVAVDLLRSEAAVLPLLAPHLPAAVPAALHWCPADSTGQPFAGVPWIPGQTACRVDPVRLASPQLAASLGTFLRALHHIPVQDALARAIPDDRYGRTHLPRRCEVVDEHTDTLARLLGPRSTEVRAMLHSWKHSPIPTARSVIHGDLYARHVLVSKNNELAGVIDWGDLHLGCPALDLAVAWSVVPRTTRAAFFSAYGPTDPHTLRLARFQALYHACRTLVYADDIADEPLLRASHRAIASVLDDPA